MRHNLSITMTTHCSSGHFIGLVHCRGKFLWILSWPSSPVSTCLWRRRAMNPAAPVLLRHQSNPVDSWNHAGSADQLLIDYWRFGNIFGLWEIEFTKRCMQSRHEHRYQFPKRIIAEENITCNYVHQRFICMKCAMCIPALAYSGLVQGGFREPNLKKITWNSTRRKENFELIPNTGLWVCEKVVSMESAHLGASASVVHAWYHRAELKNRISSVREFLWRKTRSSFLGRRWHIKVDIMWQLYVANDRPSVCLSVCVSHSWVVMKQEDVQKWSWLYCVEAYSFS